MFPLLELENIRTETGPQKGGRRFVEAKAVQMISL